MTAETHTFYVAGGTLPRNVPSYVERRADHDLLTALKAHEFCYVLDTRQVGKSSLIVRTAERLREVGDTAAILDLSTAGDSLTLEQWYFGLLTSLASGFHLDEEIDAYWTKHDNFGLGQRWFTTVQHMLLPHITGSLIVFVDEIDAVRKLPFCVDEFFAMIRSCHNRRAYNEDAGRITFCLVGVANPSDLIQDVRTTPFNIGRRIELIDFTRDEIQALAGGLHGTESERKAQIDRIYHWTAGHPYLTQKLCEAVVGEGRALSRPHVDKVCTRIFLQNQHEEDNFRFASRHILHDERQLAAILTLLAHVQSGKQRVADDNDDNADSLANRLMLSGIVRSTRKQGEKTLAMRNRIYCAVFNAAWIKANMPGAELRRQRKALRRGFFRASILWAVFGVLASLVVYQTNQTHSEKKRADTAELDKRRKDREAKQADRERQIAVTGSSKARQDQRKAEKDSHEATVTLQHIRATLAATTQLKHAVDMQYAALKPQVEKLRKDRERYATEIEKGAEQLSTLIGPVASALSQQRGKENDALQQGLRGVEPVLKLNGTPSPRAVQGLVDAVSVGVYRRLRITHPGAVYTAAFSNDDTKIITAGEGRFAYIWDVASGRLLQRLQVLAASAPHQAIWTAAFSRESKATTPSSRIITASDDGLVRIWDAESTARVQQKPLLVLNTHSALTTRAALSPDHVHVVSTGAGNAALLWDIHTGTATELKGHTDAVLAVDFSHDGLSVATASKDHTAKLWNAKSGALRYTYEGHNQGLFPRPVLSVHFDAFDDTLLTTSEDRTARSWVKDNGVLNRDYPGHVENVWDAETSEMNLYVVTAGQDRTVRLWSFHTNAAPLYVLNTHTNTVWSACFSRDRTQIVTASSDRTVEVWQFTIPTYSAFGGHAFSAAFNRSGNVVVGSSNDGLTHVWEWKTDAHVGHGSAQVGSCYCVSFAHTDNYYVAGYDNGDMRVWPYARFAEFTIDRSRLFSGHHGPVYSAEYSRDDQQLLSASGDRTAVLWDWPRATPIRAFVGHAGAVLSAHFSPDCRQIVTASKDGSVKVWEVSSEHEVQTLLPPGRSVNTQGNSISYPHAASFSPDGRLVLSADEDSNCYLWVLATGKLIGVLTGHGGVVTSAAFSPDGTEMASSSADKTVAVWRMSDVLAGGQAHPYYVIHNHSSDVTSVAYSPDGKWLVSASRDGTMRVFPATISGMVEKAHHILLHRPIETSVQ